MVIVRWPIVSRRYQNFRSCVVFVFFRAGAAAVLPGSKVKSVREAKAEFN
jgi:hypothetical protein